QGDAHVMSSAPGMRNDPDIAQFEAALTHHLPIAIDYRGGGPERATLICGFIGCDARPFNPLLSALPRLLHVPRRSAEDGVIEQIVRVALAESRVERAGSECMLARLSELLFVEVVRRYLSALPAEHAGWLAGLRDESIGRVLGKLHAQPTHDWSLEEL